MGHRPTSPKVSRPWTTGSSITRARSISGRPPLRNSAPPPPALSDVAGPTPAETASSGSSIARATSARSRASARCTTWSTTTTPSRGRRSSSNRRSPHRPLRRPPRPWRPVHLQSHRRHRPPHLRSHPARPAHASTQRVLAQLARADTVSRGRSEACEPCAVPRGTGPAWYRAEDGAPDPIPSLDARSRDDARVPSPAQGGAGGYADRPGHHVHGRRSGVQDGRVATGRVHGGRVQMRRRRKLLHLHAAALSGAAWRGCATQASGARSHDVRMPSARPGRGGARGAIAELPFSDGSAAISA